MDDLTKHTVEKCGCSRCKTRLVVNALEEALHNKGLTLIGEESNKMLKLGSTAFDMTVVNEDLVMFKGFVALGLGCAMLGSQKDVETCENGAMVMAKGIIMGFTELKKAARIIQTMEWMKEAIAGDHREG